MCGVGGGGVSRVRDDGVRSVGVRDDDCGGARGFGQLLGQGAVDAGVLRGLQKIEKTVISLHWNISHHLYI